MGTSGENINDLKNVGVDSGLSDSEPVAEFTRVAFSGEDSVNQSDDGGGLIGLESTAAEPKRKSYLDN